jgi:hypothetical protein
MLSPIRRLAGAAAFAMLLLIGPLGAAHAFDGIRVPSNTCAWEDFSWDELTLAEQRVWARLGWNARLWDSPDLNAVPTSALKDWTELNNGERTAAWQLGYTQNSWDSDCP